MKDTDAAERRQFLKEAVLSAGAGLWSGTFFERLAAADEKKPPASPPPSAAASWSRGWMA